MLSAGGLSLDPGSRSRGQDRRKRGRDQLGEKEGIRSKDKPVALGWQGLAVTACDGPGYGAREGAPSILSRSKTLFLGLRF